MSTGPVPPVPPPVPPVPPVKAGLSVGDLVAVVALVLSLICGLQYLAAHVRVSWVSPAPVPAPVPPAPPKPPTPKPFPSTWMFGGRIDHA